MWIDPTIASESLGQKRAILCPMTPSIEVTESKAFSIALFALPLSSARTRPVSMTSGITLATIITAMKREAIGSKPVHP